ncbi:peptidylprolyl isomerase [Rhabdothermincola salaria]|uniref:peptidylprolyl isomerase n=1 Tax=Rhabdothermincola salaria TaxID=2903142 RepID=UPI001E5F0EB8|nr:peptidylprolyl isomerase [Rhabdothermincola salaria]MCD9625405.1 peptidylprolyl isomerase [Rhabdothermincola salaria]
MGTSKRERQKAGHQARQSAIARAEAAAARRRRYVQAGVLALFVLVVIGGAVVLSNRDDGSDTAAPTTTVDPQAGTPVELPTPPGPGATIEGETPCPEADGSSERTTSFSAAPPMCIDPASSYTARFDTSAGPISVELDAASNPETVNNFVVLARYHYYDDTAIFRADRSIEIIQGGAPTTNSASDPGPGYTIADEGGPYTYEPGQLVMARTAAEDSAGAQFFFTAGPASSALDSQGTYVVFGTTDEAGLAVVQQILASAVDDPTSGLGGTPDPPVVIEGIEITES